MDTTDGTPQPDAPVESGFLLGVGRLIRAARENAGISQAALEREADLRPPTIAQVERGERDLGVHELIRVAAVLKTDPATFIPAAEPR
jgi:transcriptional regulator with XRE-family HTH domain